MTSVFNECYRNAQRVIGHATTVAALHTRYTNLASDIKRQMHMLTNLLTRTDELISTITKCCETLTSDTLSIKESYVAHQRAIAQIKEQQKQSRSLLTAITGILHHIQQNIQLFLSSAQTLASLAKNTEVKAYHARKEGAGLAIIAEQCLELAHGARVPFAEFSRHVHRLQGITEPITAELVNVITLSTHSGGLLSHAFQSLENLDHAVSTLQGISVRLDRQRTIGNQLKSKIAQQLIILDDYVSSSAQTINETMARCRQLRVLVQRLRRTPVAVSTAFNDAPAARENPNGDYASPLRECVDLLDQLKNYIHVPLIEERTFTKTSEIISTRIDELRVSTNDLSEDTHQLERRTDIIMQLRMNIEHFLTETHTTSSHIRECTSDLDREIAAIEDVMERTRTIFGKIKTLSIYAKIEEGRSQHHTGILAPIVHEYAQLEQRTAETYSRLMPHIVNLKLYTQRLRAEQRIPSLEIIKLPDYTKIKLLIEDVARIAGEKTRLASDLAHTIAQLHSDGERLNQAWLAYTKTLAHADEMKKHLKDLLKRPYHAEDLPG